LDDIFTVSAVALGFWGTAATLLVAVEEKSIVRKLKKGQHFRVLVGYIFAAVTWQAVVMGTTLAGAAFAQSIVGHSSLHRVFASFWLAALVGATLTTVRAYRCLSRVLRAASCGPSDD
jgi:hypothetical protein